MPPKAAPMKDARGGITTTVEVECWRQRLKSENHAVSDNLTRDIERAGDLERKNDILYYYKGKDTPERPYLQFSLDKVLLFRSSLFSTVKKVLLFELRNQKVCRMKVPK